MNHWDEAAGHWSSAYQAVAGQVASIDKQRTEDKAARDRVAKNLYIEKARLEINRELEKINTILADYSYDSRKFDNGVVKRFKSTNTLKIDYSRERLSFYLESKHGLLHKLPTGRLTVSDKLAKCDIYIRFDDFISHYKPVKTPSSMDGYKKMYFYGEGYVFQDCTKEHYIDSKLVKKSNENKANNEYFFEVKAADVSRFNTAFKVIEKLLLKIRNK